MDDSRNIARLVAELLREGVREEDLVFKPTIFCGVVSPYLHSERILDIYSLALSIFAWPATLVALLRSPAASHGFHPARTRAAHAAGGQEAEAAADFADFAAAAVCAEVEGSGLRVDGTIPKLGGLYGPLYKRHLGVPVPSTLNRVGGWRVEQHPSTRDLDGDSTMVEDQKRRRRKLLVLIEAAGRRNSG